MSRTGTGTRTSENDSFYDFYKTSKDEDGLNEDGLNEDGKVQI